MPQASSTINVYQNSASFGPVARSAHGGKIEACCDEQLVTLAGATTSSTVLIPNGALVIAVSNLVVTAMTGATS